MVVELYCAYDENDFNSSAEDAAFKVVGVEQEDQYLWGYHYIQIYQV